MKFCNYLLLVLLVIIPDSINAEDVQKLLDKNDRFSYSLGMEIGNSMKSYPITINADLLARGVKDTISGGKTLLTSEEAKKIIYGEETPSSGYNAQKMMSSGGTMLAPEVMQRIMSGGGASITGEDLRSMKSAIGEGIPSATNNEFREAEPVQEKNVMAPDVFRILITGKTKIETKEIMGRSPDQVRTNPIVHDPTGVWFYVKQRGAIKAKGKYVYDPIVNKSASKLTIWFKDEQVDKVDIIY